MDDRAKRAQGELRVISSGRRLLHDGPAVRLEAGQKHGTLHLGARHLGAVANPIQRAAVNRERRLFVVRLDPRAHQLERHHDAPHRPPGERLIADQHRRKGMAPRARRTAAASWCRNSGVERHGRGAQTAQAAALDFDRQPAFGGTRPANGDTRSGQAVQRGGAVGALRGTGAIVDGPVASAASSA